MRRFFCLFLCLVLVGVPSVQCESPKYVALTFDDGPSGRFTRRLLTGLKERDAKATFLLCGYRLEIYPELARRIAQEGHEIGLHGYSHRDMAKLSHRELTKELKDTLALLPDGCKTVFLRPPGGSESGTVAAVSKEMGLSVLLWSVDPRDWAVHDAAVVETAVISQVRSGDVILLHDLSDSSVDAALSIVDTLQGEGFQFVTVSQLAQLRGITPQPGKTYRHFRE
jgi:peptidoglycan/xylan/chitin deacetylase (PgdA/CDA1 family)